MSSPTPQFVALTALAQSASPTMGHAEIETLIPQLQTYNGWFWCNWCKQRDVIVYKLDCQRCHVAKRACTVCAGRYSFQAEFARNMCALALEGCRQCQSGNN